jgi:O-antigen/teichoic acid export membrane protein
MEVPLADEQSLSRSSSQPGSVRHRFVSNLAAVLGGQVGGILVALLAEICFARLLGPAPRGLISLCTMAIWFAALLGGLGAEIPIVIWAAGRNKKTSEWLAAVALWGLAGCVLAGFLWRFLYSHWHSSLLQGVTPELANVVLFSIPVGIFFNYLMAFFAGAERFRERAAVGFLEGLAGLAGFLAFAPFLGRTAFSAMWGNWLGLAVGLVAGAFLLRSTLHPANWAFPTVHKELRTGFLVGLYGQLGNLSSFFTYRLDVFIVNYFLNTSQVGLYALGVAVSESLWQIPQAAATALFPRTARTLQQPAPELTSMLQTAEDAATHAAVARTAYADATEFTCLILRQVLLISCVSGALLALASPLAIPLVFGARFSPSVGVIWWILPGTVALSLAKVAASDLAGRHKTAYSSAAGIAALIVTVVLDFILIPRMGIRGAALASSVAYLINSVILLLALRHELQVPWRSLLVPSRAEFLRYQQLWLRIVARRKASAS